MLVMDKGHVLVEEQKIVLMSLAALMIHAMKLQTAATIQQMTAYALQILFVVTIIVVLP